MEVHPDGLQSAGSEPCRQTEQGKTYRLQLTLLEPLTYTLSISGGAELPVPAAALRLVRGHRDTACVDVQGAR